MIKPVHYLLFVLLIIIAVPIIIKYTEHNPSSPHQLNRWSTTFRPKINQTTTVSVLPLEVLLIFVYANNQAQAPGNLKYFIDTAVKDNDGVDYYFIVQRMDNKPIDQSTLPFLPSRNARYIEHDNVCFDFGTVGWFLNKFTYGNPWRKQLKNHNKTINLKTYKYFILLNSSVRGPYLPPYFLKFAFDYEHEFHQPFPWYKLYTNRLDNRMKMIGSTISCQLLPHIQSYILVTDRVGMKILLKPGSDGGTFPEGIFHCHTIKEQGSEMSEIPASNRIREAGYTIGSMLTKYNGVDFNLKHNYNCAQAENPYIEDRFDGVRLEPYEVLFVKYNDADAVRIIKDRASLYEEWTAETKQEDPDDW